ncbi:hypothetical protein P4S72_13740 [Vibrio sp. PP-XX7]
MDIDVVFSEERTNYPIDVSVNDTPGICFSLDVHADTRIGTESERGVNALAA